MVQRKQKKNVKLRGSKTHGYGSMKKHRGAGHRGGRGNAGSGKRADSKKPSIWKRGNRNPEQIGFVNYQPLERTTINVGHLDSIAARMVREGKAKEASGMIVIDLSSMDTNKLLGAGKVTHKLHVTVELAVPLAKEKIEKAGGKIEATIVDRETVKADREARAEEFRKKNSKAPPQATKA